MTVPHTEQGERLSGWDLFGPNLGRFKDDPDWDAIHVLAPGERETTLGGKSLDDVASACSMDTGYKPDIGNGCWTCLSTSNRPLLPRRSAMPDARDSGTTREDGSVMNLVEHWFGVEMAAGYDAQDFIDLADSVAGRPCVERVTIRNYEPDTPRGAVEALRELAEAVIADAGGTANLSGSVNDALDKAELAITGGR